MAVVPTLRELLQRPEMLVVPGAYDAIGARMIEHAGFAAAYMTGAGTSAARGYPDFGLLTMSEMVESAATLARSIKIPLIADADTGYGNELNVTRTVREYEARGVAAIHIEDQVSPKRCGHLDGKQVIPRDEFVSKICAAVEARHSKDFLIIARSDARAMISLEEAIARVNAAFEVGADVAFVEAPQTVEEVASIPKAVRGPCLLNVVPGGRTPLSDLRQAGEMGYRLAILPGLLIQSTLVGGAAALAHVKTHHAPPPAAENIGEGFRRFGADEWEDVRERFNAGARAVAKAR